MTNNLLERDISKFLNTYAKFTYKAKSKMKYSILKGEIDICDINGNYWNSFNIVIYIEQQRYPYTVPLVQEVSEKLKREDDWHLDKNGYCCLDIDHELEYMSKKGINISSFYQEKIYPFFTNSLYKKRNGNYASSEYKHHFKGVIQFYNEKLKLNDFSVIIKILDAVIENEIPGRNQPCICGSDTKIKKCHLVIIDFLKTLSKARLQKDLEGFNELLSEKSN